MARDSRRKLQLNLEEIELIVTRNRKQPVKEA